MAKTYKNMASVYFSPKGGCTDAIVEQINKVKSHLFIQAYTFTSTAILEALIAAKERKVMILVILDKFNSEANGSLFPELIKADIPVWLDSKHRCAHNKIMILDDVVITGSFNFTVQAENSNAENMLIIENHDMAMAYLKNWQDHQAHSVQYIPKKKRMVQRPSVLMRIIHWLSDVLERLGQVLGQEK